MAQSHDLFANFERMRREIDELFGDVFERQTGLRGRGFSPSVDVFYVDDPPRAVVKADLAGIDIADVALEIRGRQLLIAGERRSAEAGGRLYMAVSRLAFETNRVQIHQFLGVRTEEGGRSGIPLRPWWDQLREVRSPALDEHRRRSRIAASR